MSAKHILIVEDDAAISGLVARCLGDNGLKTSIAETGREMRRIMRDAKVNLIVLDLMLPDGNGLEFCRKLRETSNVPIIMLTAKSDEIERIIGLETGADDYIGKPFNPRELLARIRAVLRRHNDISPDAPGRMRSFVFEGWRLETAERRLFDPDGNRVVLTAAEHDLLVVFCERPGRVLTRDSIIELTHDGSLSSSQRSVDILVSRLRQKIEWDPRDPRLFQTVRSSGYVFSCAVDTE